MGLRFWGSHSANVCHCRCRCVLQAADRRFCYVLILCTAGCAVCCRLPLEAESAALGAALQAAAVHSGVPVGAYVQQHQPPISEQVSCPCVHGCTSQHEGSRADCNVKCPCDVGEVQSLLHLPDISEHLIC
jgi:hypothetical protein